MFLQPDLPFRLEHGIPLTVGDRSTYYVYGSPDPKGFTDYPFSEGYLKAADTIKAARGARQKHIF